MTKPVTINLDLKDSKITHEEIKALAPKLDQAHKKLHSGKEDFTGWVNLPVDFDKDEVARIKKVALDIRSKCNAFVLIGIGGSYLGARAAIEMLAAGGPEAKGTWGLTPGPEIYYAGLSISATYHKRLLKELEDKEVCLCVISKSGTTTEPAIAFSILKDMMLKKYGKVEAARRIIAITDKKSGVIREEADREGYESFVVPDDIGGRYSVLTPVGLLPVAVAGIDIDEMLAGAGDMRDLSAYENLPGDQSLPIEQDMAAAYAATRVLLAEKGKAIEVYESYEPDLFYFCEWLKQLFGESEGKDGKGIFPASLQLSTDLHSMGQFLQEGNQIFFETVLNVVSPPCDIDVPKTAGGHLAGISMNSVNQAALAGVMEAHRKTGIPMIKIDIPAINPYYFGQIVYFFERTCALSGYLIDVNPFDQPGVEAYKAEMRKELEKSR